MITATQYYEEPQHRVPDWERGAVTAEFATTLPAVMVLLAVVIAIAAAFGAQYRVSDAARAAARFYAVNPDRGQAQALVNSIVGGNPTLKIDPPGSPWATVTVSMATPGVPGWLPIPTPTAQAKVF